MFGGPTGDGWFADHPPYPDPALGVVQLQQLVVKLTPEHRKDAQPAFLPWGQIDGSTRAAGQGEAGLRVPQGEVLDSLRHPSRFRLIGAEELAPGRRVEKEVPHRDRRARRPRGGARLARPVAFNVDASGSLGHTRARHQGQSAHGGDRSQRLPAEPQARNRRQALRVADRARRMCGHRQRQLIEANPYAVVSNPDQVTSAVLDFDVDLHRLGVDRVLDQLLDHAGRSRDDFTRGDLVDDERCKSTNRHGRWEELGVRSQELGVRS